MNRIIFNRLRLKRGEGRFTNGKGWMEIERPLAVDVITKKSAVQETKEEVKAVQGEVCDMVNGEDKKQLCKIVLEKHSNMEISTKEAEEQLSDLTGEDIKLVEEPDWKLLGQDRDKLESWATAVCMTYEVEDESKINACVDVIDNIVKGQETVDSGSQKIGKLMREDPEEVAKTLMVTAPNAETENK